MVCRPSGTVGSAEGLGDMGLDPRHVGSLSINDLKLSGDILVVFSLGSRRVAAPPNVSMKFRPIDTLTSFLRSLQINTSMILRVACPYRQKCG